MTLVEQGQLEQYHGWKEKYGHLFDEDEDGLPVSGQVIMYFRERRHLTTEELAKVLLLTKRTVERMEHENLFLDSITRRRAIAAALRIPPMLLGITTFRGMPMLQVSQSPTVQTTAKTATTSIETLKEALLGYRTLHQTHTAQSKLAEIEQSIQDQRKIIVSVSGDERTKRLYILWTYYLFVIGVARDERNYPAVFRYANKAVDLARELKNTELMATAYTERATAYYERGRPSDLEAAKKDFETSLKYASQSRGPIRGFILGNAAVTFAHAAQDQKDKSKALGLLGQCGNLIGTEPIEDGDLYNPVLTRELWYQNARASNVIASGFLEAGKSGEAISVLDEMFDLIPDGTRLMAFNHTYRAKAEAMQGHYPFATQLAGFALDIFDKTNSVHGLLRIGQVVNDLSNHPTYGDSVELAQLRVRLIDRKRRQWAELENE
jgi:transcriptional regulator with XRE-family HTH domain